MSTTFGEKLKQVRIEKRLKQSELAKKLGVTNTTISNWENNVSKPDLDMLSYICGVLEIKAGYFLESKLPADEISIPEYEHIRKYRALDVHGKEMVDFTLLKEWERVNDEHSLLHNVETRKPDYLILEAAHNDAELTEEEIENMNIDLERLDNL